MLFYSIIIHKTISMQTDEEAKVALDQFIVHIGNGFLRNNINLMIRMNEALLFYYSRNASLVNKHDSIRYYVIVTYLRENYIRMFDLDMLDEVNRLCSLLYPIVTNDIVINI